MPDPQMTKAETKPKSENAKKEHKQDFYNLIIGFEVNTPEAFGPSTWFPSNVYVHKIDKDPGHTFMYLTKNRMIMFFFSLGPGKEGLSSTRERAYGQGKSDYHITGKTKLFRLSITESQYKKMLSKGMEYAQDIESGKRYYNIAKNFTCARAARDIIQEGWPAVPQGASPIVFYGVDVSSPIRASVSLVNPPLITFVNPYAFYRDMEKAFPSKEVQLDENESEWEDIMSDTYDRAGGREDPCLAPHLWRRGSSKPESMAPPSFSWGQGQFPRTGNFPFPQ